MHEAAPCLATYLGGNHLGTEQPQQLSAYSHDIGSCDEACEDIRKGFRSKP